MVSLLTLLLLADSRARAQVAGSVDPTDLQVRGLNIDAEQGALCWGMINDIA
jgi:hypothetical protein